MATAAVLAQQLAEYDAGIAAMRANAMGGAYGAIFMNKRLTVKTDKAKDQIKDLLEDVKGVFAALPPVHIELPTINIDLRIPALLKQLRAALGRLVNLAKDEGKKALRYIRDLFMRLLDAFPLLHDMLINGFGDILKQLNFIDLRAMFSWMIDLMAPIFRDFIGSIVAAIVPLLQQLAALKDLLTAIGKAVKAAYERLNVGYAGTFVSSNEFNEAAIAQVIRSLDIELAKSGGALIGAIGHATNSIATAPVHASGTVTGIAKALVKLMCRIASYIHQYKSIEKANLQLEYMDYKPMHRSPSALFSAAPVLGAIYINRQSTSNLMPFLDVGGGRKPTFFNRHPNNIAVINDQVKIEKMNKKIQPLKNKCREMEAASQLELVEKGVADTRAKLVIEELATETVEDYFEGAET